MTKYALSRHHKQLSDRMIYDCYYNKEVCQQVVKYPEIDVAQVLPREERGSKVYRVNIGLNTDKFYLEIESFDKAQEGFLVFEPARGEAKSHLLQARQYAALNPLAWRGEEPPPRYYADTYLFGQPTFRQRRETPVFWYRNRKDPRLEGYLPYSNLITFKNVFGDNGVVNIMVCLDPWGNILDAVALSDQC